MKKLFLKLFNLAKENFVLLLIIFLAFCIRSYGIYFDYPRGVNFIWDEIFSMSYLMDVIQYKTIFTPSPYQYPLLLPLLYVPILVLRVIYIAITNCLFSIEEIKNYLVVNGMGQINIIVRWYSVFFGTATVFLIYKIGRIVFKSRHSSYYAALVYAVSLVPVYMAHWGKLHSAMVFFLILSLYFVLKFEREKSTKNFYLSCLFAACAFSIHYLGISAAIFPFWGFIRNYKSFNLKIIAKASVLFLGVSGFFYLVNFKGFLGMYANNIGYFKNTGFVGMYEIGGWERFYYVFRDSFVLEPVFLVVFLGCLVFSGAAIFKDRLKSYFLVGIAANYLLMISLVAWPQMNRWLLVFMSLAFPFGAAFLMEFLSARKIPKVIIFFLALLLVAPSGIITVQWLKLTNHNTRLEVLEWLQQNLGQDIVYSFDRYLDAPLSYRAATWMKEENHVNSSKKVDYILQHPAEFEGKGINLFYDYDVGRWQDLGGKDTKYIIVYYWRFNEMKQSLIPGKKEADEILSNVSKYHQLELIKTFYPTKRPDLITHDVDYLNNPISWKTLFYLDKSGPFMEIYEVK